MPSAVSPPAFLPWPRALLFPKPGQAKYFRKPSPSTPANADKAEQWLDGWHTEASRIQKVAGKKVPLEEWWQGGTAPALILQGLNDKIAPPQNALNLALKRPNTKLIGLPNAGHAMTPEVPEVIAEETIRFARAVELADPVKHWQPSRCLPRLTVEMGGRDGTQQFS